MAHLASPGRYLLLVRVPYGAGRNSPPPSTFAGSEDILRRHVNLLCHVTLHYTRDSGYCAAQQVLWPKSRGERKVSLPVTWPFIRETEQSREVPPQSFEVSIRETERGGSNGSSYLGMRNERTKEQMLTLDTKFLAIVGEAIQSKEGCNGKSKKINFAMSENKC